MGRVVCSYWVMVVKKTINSHRFFPDSVNLKSWALRQNAPETTAERVHTHIRPSIEASTARPLGQDCSLVRPSIEASASSCEEFISPVHIFIYLCSCFLRPCFLSQDSYPKTAGTAGYWQYFLPQDTSTTAICMLGRSASLTQWTGNNFRQTRRMDNNWE